VERVKSDTTTPHKTVINLLVSELGVEEFTSVSVFVNRTLPSILKKGQNWANRFQNHFGFESTTLGCFRDRVIAMGQSIGMIGLCTSGIECFSESFFKSFSDHCFCVLKNDSQTLGHDEI